MRTIAYSELVEVARKVVIKNKDQVLKNPKKNKVFGENHWINI